MYVKCNTSFVIHLLAWISKLAYILVLPFNLYLNKISLQVSGKDSSRSLEKFRYHVTPIIFGNEDKWPGHMITKLKALHLSSIYLQISQNAQNSIYMDLKVFYHLIHSPIQISKHFIYHPTIYIKFKVFHSLSFIYVYISKHFILCYLSVLHKS